MRLIDSDELRKLQLAILKDVHQFCIDNGIRYSLAYGTLLGAVRHKGYIPWDDDIDIMMPREDYEVFLRTYSNEYYKIASSATMSSCYLPFAKVYDTRTLVEEYVEYPIGYGVNIDVFPLDNIPDSECEFSYLLRRKKFWNTIYDLKIVKLSKDRSFYKNAVLLLSHLFLSIIPIYKISEKMRVLCIKFNAEPTKRVGIVAPSDSNEREVWNRNTFSEYTFLSFEGTEVSAIKNFHDFLESAYGNYMELPPENKRVTHHNFSAYWKE